MGTMRALRAHVRGGPGQLVYEQAPAPAAGPGEALVAVHAAAITFAELTWDLSWTTRDGADRTPVIPSHELSGVIAGLGPGVTNLAVGDAVIGLIDFDRDGAAAEYVAVPATTLAAKPTRCPISRPRRSRSRLTAWQALVDHAAVAPGERVLVLGGAGGVGVFAVQLAALLGATSPPPAGRPTLTSCAAWARNASSVPAARMPSSRRASSTWSSTPSAARPWTARTACCARAAGW